MPRYLFQRGSGATIPNTTAAVLANEPRIWQVDSLVPLFTVERGTKNLIVQDINQWTLINVTRSSNTTDYLPSILAFRIFEAANTGEHAIQSPTLSLEPNKYYTFSLWLSPNIASQRVKISFNFGPNDTGGITFDIDSASIVASDPGFFGAVDLSYPWQRLAVTHQMSASPSNGTIKINFVDGTELSYTGNSSRGFSLIRPQLEANAFPTTFTDIERDSEFVTLPAQLLNLEQGTIEIFARTGVLRRDPGYTVFLAAATSLSSYDAGRRFMIGADYPESGFNIVALLPNDQAIVGPALEATKNYYIALTYSSTNGYRLFINGQYYGSAPYQGPFNFERPYLYLGNWITHQTQEQHLTNISFYGVRFSNTEKSSSDIAAIARQFTVTKRLPMPDNSTRYMLYIDLPTLSLKEFIATTLESENFEFKMTNVTSSSVEVVPDRKQSLITVVPKSEIVLGKVPVYFKRPTRALERYTSNRASPNNPRFEQGKYGKAILIESGTMNFFTSCNLGNFDNGQLGAPVPGSYTGYPSNVASYSVVYDYGYRGLGARCYIQSVGTGNTYIYFPQTRTLPAAFRNWSFSWKEKWIQLPSHASRHDESALQELTFNGGRYGNGTKKPRTYMLNSEWLIGMRTMGDPNYQPSSDYYYAPWGTWLESLPRIGGKSSIGAYAIEFVIDEIQLEPTVYPTSYTDEFRADEVLYMPASVLKEEAGTLAGWFYEDLSWRKACMFATDNGSLTVMKDGVLSGTTTYKVLINGTEVITGVSLPAEMQWIHVALTWTTNMVTLYINGQQVGSASITSPIDLSNATWLYIGSAGPGIFCWNDLIDDFRISTTTWSSNDVQRVFNATIPEAVDDITDYKLTFDDSVEVITLPKAYANITNNTSYRIKLFTGVEECEKRAALVKVRTRAQMLLSGLQAQDLTFSLINNDNLLNQSEHVTNLSYAELYSLDEADEQRILNAFGIIVEEPERNSNLQLSSDWGLKNPNEKVVETYMGEKFNLADRFKEE